MKRNRFNKMSYIILLITAQILWSIPQTKAQTTLDECQRLAEQNYPLIRDYGLIEKSTNYSLSNVSKIIIDFISSFHV